MLEGVIFDLDGTMFDTEQYAWQPAWTGVGRRLGLSNPELLYQSIVGLSGEEEIHAAQAVCGPDVDVAAVVAEATKEAERISLEGVPMKRGLLELLDYLQGRGVPMAIGSSNKEHIIEHLTKAAGIRGYFSAICYGSLVERPKPAPDIFLLAAEMLGVSPANTLVVDDSLAGAEAGLAGSFITVMIPDMKKPTSELLGRGLHVCPDLGDLRERLMMAE